MSKKPEQPQKDWQAVEEKSRDIEEQAEAEMPGEQSDIADLDIEALQDELTTARAKAEEHWDKALRATSELENVRRRSARDLENAHKYGIEKLLNQILPVVDSLEQALQAKQQGEADPDALSQGVELTLKMLLDALGKFAVTPIDPQGEAFDPHQHEAMSMQDAPDAEPGTVLMVIQKGFLLHDRVLRPARVIVAKAATKNVDEQA